MTTTAKPSRWILELAAEAAGYAEARDAAEEFSDAWMAADIRVGTLCDDAAASGEFIAFSRELARLTAR